MATTKHSDSPKTPRAAEPKPAKPAAQTAAPTERNARKVRLGMVVSDRMTNTVVVRIERVVQHKLYPRTIRRSNTFKAHNEGNVAKRGDLVRIMETRPLSKTKRWRIVEIVRRGSAAPEVPGSEETSSTKAAA